MIDDMVVHNVQSSSNNATTNKLATSMMTTQVESNTNQQPAVNNKQGRKNVCNTLKVFF